MVICKPSALCLLRYYTVSNLSRFRLISNSGCTDALPSPLSKHDSTFPLKSKHKYKEIKVLNKSFLWPLAPKRKEFNSDLAVNRKKKISFWRKNLHKFHLSVIHSKTYRFFFDQLVT